MLNNFTELKDLLRQNNARDCVFFGGLENRPDEKSFTSYEDFGELISGDKNHGEIETARSAYSDYLHLKNLKSIYEKLLLNIAALELTLHNISLSKSGKTVLEKITRKDIRKKIGMVRKFEISNSLVLSIHYLCLLQLRKQLIKQQQSSPKLILETIKDIKDIVRDRLNTTQFNFPLSSEEDSDMDHVSSTLNRMGHTKRLLKNNLTVAMIAIKKDGHIHLLQNTKFNLKLMGLNHGYIFALPTDTRDNELWKAYASENHPLKKVILQHPVFLRSVHLDRINLELSVQNIISNYFHTDLKPIKGESDRDIFRSTHIRRDL
jgi:hypothetical protein